MKLYPPYIEGVLPAFCENETGNSILTVPFTMNKTVSVDSVWGFALRMKTVQSNQLVYTTRQQTNLDTNKEVYFNIIPKNFINPHTLNIGQFYKIQIAYIAKQQDSPTEPGETGYFSTVGVVKYTAKPELSIGNMNANELHSDLGTYEGRYYNNGDVTEKLYSYRFDVYDNHDTLIVSSGDQLHNHETDIAIDETTDEFTLPISLEENKIYKIIYSGITTNGMSVSSPYYRIVQQSSIPPEIEADVIATMNKENGYVQIRIQGHIDPINGLEKNGIGTFQILRASELGNFTDWQVIKKFALFGSPPSKVDIKDFTIEQGKSYKYALQQYNDDTNLVSDKIYSGVILSDFEDLFLYDGKRQLKIKYNPKISSFKQTIQEAKTITLGQKYPFILRNGKGNYKEFPISGLISYHMDEENLFIQDKDLGIDNYPSILQRTKTLRTGITSKDIDYFQQLSDKYGLAEADKIQNLYADRNVVGSDEYLIANQKKRTTNLLDYNIAAERIFKLKVLEFLNDGQPKLFRSPGEGNYIVRLMNSSLSPNDQLGRMLHNFSTTAVEIEDFSSTSLEDLGIISTKELDTRQQRWETILLSSVVNNPPDSDGWIKINRYTANSIQCLDMIPGTQIRITFSDSLSTPLIINIGATGAYYSNLNRDIETIEINNIIFKTSLQGQITYGFYGTTFNHFDTYKKVIINDIPLIQFVGEQRDENSEQIIDIKTKLTDVRNIITNFNLLHFVKRDVVPVYKYGNKFSLAPLYFNTELAEALSMSQTMINLKQYDSTYSGGKESIFWAPTSPNKQEYWETIYSFDNNIDKKGVINIRAVVASPDKNKISQTNEFVSLDICYQTNQQLIEFKEKMQSLGYNYKGSIRIDSNLEKELNKLLVNYNQNDVIIVNGVTSYLCTKQKNSKQWTQLSEKLGTIITVNSNSDSWFRIEADNEYITEIKLRLPQLKSKEKREGYVVYEKYLDLPQEQLDEIDSKDFNPLCIYKIINNANFNNTDFSEELYFDPQKGNYVKYSNIIQLDDQYLDINETEEYQVTIPSEVDKLYIPSGVLADIGVQRRTIEYGIETKQEYNNLIQLKSQWQTALEELQNFMFNETLYTNEEDYIRGLSTKRNKENSTYKTYIEELQKQLNILAGEAGNF